MDEAKNREPSIANNDFRRGRQAGKSSRSHVGFLLKNSAIVDVF
jgi:hypothetical protein